ncbi:IclR family transcriptional regulator [Herbaspirillum frisingense]|uniref:IclR family transcriptional regulator n=1 Tax=Herbaspirillum frisingense TaxID=92645 RepID=UPI001F25CF7F|nr:IclR family transcriptional regulator [Herbaspirillum frisingense]UIN22021.1 IclR family transcriptional regulator [Herbaspirillum frisingense]
MTRLHDMPHEADEADDGAKAQAQRGIQSLDSTGALLEALLEAARPLPLGDLARLAGMPAAKAFPHLVSLQKIGLLARDAQGNFFPGPLSLELGLAALQRLSPLREAEAEVAPLAEATGLSVALAVFGPLGPTVVRLEESSRPQHVSLRIGTVLSMVHTAIGRVCAAHQPADTLAGALAMDAIRMEGAQADTVLHGDGALRHDYAARLRQIRADGMDQALGRPVPGINTLAAPVFNHAGQLALVMAVMGSSGSYDTDFAGEVGQLLAASARRVSWRLGAIDAGAGEGAGR